MKSVFVTVMSACIFDYVLNDWGGGGCMYALTFYKIMEKHTPPLNVFKYLCIFACLVAEHINDKAVKA
jgi:hypothetical protein